MPSVGLGAAQVKDLPTVPQSGYRRLMTQDRGGDRNAGSGRTARPSSGAVSATRVRIIDVAAAAGVSQSTASKALNGSPEIGASTRAHVQETAARLGYRPNVLARTLKGWRSQSIGVLTDDEEGFFSTSMMRGIEGLANQNGFSVFLCNTLGEVGLERHHLMALLDKKVDGIIMLGAEMKARGGPAVNLHGVPNVYLYCYEAPLRTPSVIPDDRGGARTATEHLTDLGHRSIVFLNGPSRYEASRERLDGYREALESAGILFDPRLVRTSSTDWFPRAGYDMLRDVLAKGIIPDAVFAASDHLASGALSALQSAQIRVPDDISLVGFDDRPVAAELPVPLTTMALPQEEMGRRAADLLLRAIGGEAVEPALHVVPPVLVKRQSVLPRAVVVPT